MRCEECEHYLNAFGHWCAYPGKIHKLYRGIIRLFRSDRCPKKLEPPKQPAAGPWKDGKPPHDGRPFLGQWCATVTVACYGGKQGLMGYYWKDYVDPVMLPTTTRPPGRWAEIFLPKNK